MISPCAVQKKKEEENKKIISAALALYLMY